MVTLRLVARSVKLAPARAFKRGRGRRKRQRGGRGRFSPRVLSESSLREFSPRVSAERRARKLQLGADLPTRATRKAALQSR